MFEDFWLDISKINPNSMLSSNILGNAKGDKEISDLFYDNLKYYSTVCLLVSDMSSICNVINKCITVEDFIQVTLKIVSDCIKMLKPRKNDGK